MMTSGAGTEEVNYCVVKVQEESKEAYAAVMYAWKTFIKELRDLPTDHGNTDEEIENLINRWGLVEFEADGIERIGISFPEDIVPVWAEYLRNRKEQEEKDEL